MTERKGPRQPKISDSDLDRRALYLDSLRPKDYGQRRPDRYDELPLMRSLPAGNARVGRAKSVRTFSKDSQ